MSVKLARQGRAGQGRAGWKSYADDNGPSRVFLLGEVLDRLTPMHYNKWWEGVAALNVLYA